MQAIKFTKDEIQKPQTVLNLKITGEPSTPATSAPVSFSLTDIVPERVMNVGGNDVRFPGTMSDDEIQTASMDVYGQKAEGRGLMGALEDFWHRVDPLEMAKGLNQAVQHPIETVKQVGQAQGALLDKAKAKAAEGDYVTATRHFVEYLLPLLGPAISEEGDKAQRGDIAGAIGGSAGLGLVNLAPIGIAKAQSVKLPTGLKNRNPVAREAVEFAQAEGIPVTPGTATGNSVVLGAEKLADHTSLSGSVIGGRASQVHNEALAATGARQAARAHPSAVTPEQAGMGVRDVAEAAVVNLDRLADTHYGRFRDIANSNVQSVPVTTQGRVAGGGTIPVQTTKQIAAPMDVSAFRQKIAPMYETMLRDSKHVPLMGSESIVFRQLTNLMEGSPMIALETVDRALGALKSMARGNGQIPALRNYAQGSAGNAVKLLEAQVEFAAKQLGADAWSALQKGREATRAKFAAGEIYEAIKTEPVSAFRQTTAAADSGIAQLRELAKIAPSELPKIGRAYLDSLLDVATKEGGFTKTSTVHTAWKSLGPETKKLLFKDPAYIKDLDNFFRYAEMAAKNPNLSGSAYVGGLLMSAYRFTDPVSGLMYEIGGAALSKALHSPKVAKLLTNSLRVPMGTRPAVIAASGNLMRALQEAHVPMVSADPSRDNPPR